MRASSAMLHSMGNWANYKSVKDNCQVQVPNIIGKEGTLLIELLCKTFLIVYQGREIEFINRLALKSRLIWQINGTVHLVKMVKSSGIV